MSETIKGYTLVNSEKLDRAVNGTVGREGRLYGGIGEKASDEAKLAAYDKLGGLIKKGKNKVKIGSFYDFEKRKPREKPDVKLVFRGLEGEEIVLDEGEEKPIEVIAAEKIQEKKNKKKNKKEADKRVAKAKAKKVKKADDD